LETPTQVEKDFYEVFRLLGLYFELNSISNCIAAGLLAAAAFSISQDFWASECLSLAFSHRICKERICAFASACEASS
jgi:hypothetical protein